MGLKSLLRRGTGLFLASLTFLTFLSCDEQEEVQAKWLTITQDGAWEKDIDVSGLKPGEDDIELGSRSSFYFPWQGEDSIDYRYSDGLLWVNGKIVGVDLQYVDYSQIPEPESILTVNVYRIDASIPDMKSFPNLAVANVRTVYDSTIKDIKPIPKCVKLYAVCEDISDKGLGQLSRLTNLRGLWLASDNITPKGVKYLSKFRNLRLLWFGDESYPPSMFNEGLKHIARLKKLQVLNLWFGILDRTEMNYLTELKSLRGLRLFYIEIGDADISQLSNLTNLRELRLYESGFESTVFTWFSDEMLEQLSGLPNLHVLSFDGVQLTEESLVPIGKIKNLRELYFSETWLRRDCDPQLEYLKGLSNLRRLSIVRNGVEPHQLVHIKEIPELRDLSLADNWIQDEGLSYLAGLKNLERLNLFGSGVTDAGLVHLEGLSKLRKLNLEVTDVTPAGVERLQKALPECEIRY